MKISQTLYRTKEWKEFRLLAIEHADYKCESCDRLQADGAILQVHHDRYFRGQLPWQYNFSEVTVLCKGCHAEAHNKIMATSNWEYQDHNDLGDVIGYCDFCTTPLRHEHFISHPNWGELTVGEKCSDFLTETKEATTQRKIFDRKMRFIDAKKWTSLSPFIQETKRRNLTIRIISENKFYFVEINGTRSKKSHPSDKAAKFATFENGIIVKYFNLKKK
jgi:hypothetical protein